MTQPRTDPGPRPVHPIIHDGGPNEVRDLTQASQVRRLTDAERLRLAGLTFTTDPTLERARLLLTRHPDLAHLVPQEIVLGLEQVYESKRSAAIAAGRTVADPAPGVVAEVDRLAALYRETEHTPARFVDLEARHRTAFAAAVQASGVGPDAMAIWTAWLAEHDERNGWMARRSSALAGLGRPGGGGRQWPPIFLEELDLAAGGGTLRSWMPINQR